MPTDHETEPETDPRTQFYYVCFPDKGAGRTKYVGYVEGDSERDVRRRAAEIPSLNLYDTTAGNVIARGLTRETLPSVLSSLANPNDAWTIDGTVLRTDRETGTMYETTLNEN